jgi:hypothetical protein
MLSQILSSIARKRHVPAKGWKVLTGKDYPKFNKGKRAMKAGFMDKWKNFHVMQYMRPEYIMPNMASGRLRPYVAREAKSGRQEP